MARPTTPAPAKSGAVSMPISDRTMIATMTMSAISMARRANGRSVRRRAPDRPRPEFGLEMRQAPLDDRADHLPDDERHDHDHGDRDDAADDLAPALRREPAERIDAPGLENGERREGVDDPAQRRLHHGQIAVGALLQQRIAVAQIAADGEDAFDEPAHARGRDLGDRDDQERQERAAHDEGRATVDA